VLPASANPEQLKNRHPPSSAPQHRDSIWGVLLVLPVSQEFSQASWPMPLQRQLGGCLFFNPAKRNFVRERLHKGLRRGIRAYSAADRGKKVLTVKKAVGGVETG
jgi:hypothetical protein